MTNNTIPNVPRELLERVLNAGWGSETVNALDDLRDFLESASSSANHVEDVRAMVADPSPAGVDGLEVVATAILGGAEYGIGGPELGEIDVELSMSTLCRIQERMVSNEDSVYLDLCRLSAAQAIIDGLRGEVESRVEAALAADRAVRHQQAQRIGELEGLLYEASGELRTDRHHGLGPRIAAALSAGKEGE